MSGIAKQMILALREVLRIQDGREVISFDAPRWWNRLPAL